jgi:4-amino-4-deoxy-L-arabinose transferase-like glycosyltransferase
VTPTRTNRLILLALWLVFYGSFTLFAPPLLDDADSVHAEVAREMLLRHDFVTLYANGIRYLEKAPLYYWSMAASMKLFGATTAASRLPLAFSVLALALLLESFARRAFSSARAGLYAGLITLSSFGIFIFSRINIPDVPVCVLLTLALYAFFLTEQQSVPSVPHLRAAKVGWTTSNALRLLCWLFAAAIALNILTKGLIGVVFPFAIVGIYLLLTRGLRGTRHRLRQLHPVSSLAVLLTIAVPWHILIALANPGHGHPGHIARIDGHWQVPLPTDGNVHGWAWFYFLNEQLYRYLNIRVPHDYDTSPLWLFYGLIFVWLMPWSAFLPSAIRRAWPSLRRCALDPAEQTNLFLLVWMAVPLLFFSLSTRQEYYVLPALPPMILLIARLLSQRDAGEYTSSIVQEAMPDGSEILSDHFRGASSPSHAAAGRGDGSRPGDASDGSAPGKDAPRRTGPRTIDSILLAIGILAALGCLFFLFTSRTQSPSTDLASLLNQNPGDYALSFGHFLDLTGPAMALFRLPLALTALALFASSLAHFLLRRRGLQHAATLALAAGAFLFLFAAWLGLRTFSPTLTSYQLAEAIRPQLHPQDLIAIHGEYEAGSTLGFYLRRNDLHIVEGRSSNLWYGSFFPDAPPIFETRESIAQKWHGPQRIFLWQDPNDRERPPLALSQPVYMIASSGGKQILSNKPNL